MKKLDNIMEKLNAPISEEQIKQIVYTVFAVVIFLLPIVPELMGIFVYSLKCTLFNVVTIVTSIILLCINISDKKIETKINKYDVILGIYLALVIISTLFSKYNILNCILGTNGRGEGLITIFSYIATFCIMSKGYKYLKGTIKLAIIGAIIVSVYGLLQAVVPLEYNLIIRDKPIFGVATGTMRNQNMFSSYLCIFLPMMCYYYLDTKKKRILPIVAVLFAALVFTRTLGGYLTFAGMYVIIVAFELWRGASKKRSIISILILSLVLFGTFELTTLKSKTYVAEIKSTKQEVVNLKKNDGSFATSRLEIWNKTLMVIENNILLGTGPDSLKKELIKSEYRTNGENDMLNHYIVDKAHCEYLQIAATTGVPSLIVYLIFIGILMIELLKSIIIKSIKAKKDREDDNTKKNRIYLTTLFIGVASYLVQALANFSVVQVAPVFWAIMGLAAGNLMHEKE